MKTLKVFLGVAIMAVLTGCSGLPVKSSLMSGQMKDALVTVSDKKFIRTRGIGVPATDAVGKTHRRGLARNAALVSARYEMLQVIKGIHVSGGITIGNLMQKDGSIVERADRMIHGSVEVQSEFTTDDGCVTVIELERSKVDELVNGDRPYEQRYHNPELKEETRVPVHYRLDGKTPTAAFAAGVLFPGGAYWYSDRKAEGVLHSAGIMALYGAGVAMLSKANKIESMPSDKYNTENHETPGDRDQNQGAGALFIVAGAVAQLASAWKGAKELDDSSYVTVEWRDGIQYVQKVWKY